MATKNGVKNLMTVNVILKHINNLPEELQQTLFQICALKLKKRETDWMQAENAIERIFKTPMAIWTKEAILKSLKTFIVKHLKLLEEPDGDKH